MTSADILTAYNASRDDRVDRSVLCHAPFVSLNFDQSGNVTACCYNREYVLGTYPTQSVQQIWEGEPARTLREAFLNDATAPGCNLCFEQIKSRNFSGALLRNFDRFSVGLPPRLTSEVAPPLVLEFELSNTCSLECVMCGGHWSSAIRAKREKLPPLTNPYDREFVDQIAELLPSVVMAKFLGGEPFLITQYHDIWGRLAEINPSAEISITTSGAVVPARPRHLLDSLRAHIVVSLDGITKTTYEAIRQNATFETVMANIADFRAYTRHQGTTLTIACCPMTHNWQELRSIVDFCEQQQATLFFNTVTRPVESSLVGLPEPALAEVVERLEEEGRQSADAWSPQIRDQWHGLVNQLRDWLQYKRDFLHETRRASARARLFVATCLDDGGDAPAGSYESIMPALDALVLAHRTERHYRLPRLPLDLWNGGAPPNEGDLLLATNLFRHFVDDGEPDAAASSTRATAASEHRLLETFLQQASHSPEAWMRVGLNARWTREQFEQALSVKETLYAVQRLVWRMDEAVEELFAQLREGRGTLHDLIGGTSTDPRSLIQRYLRRLVEWLNDEDISERAPHDIDDAHMHDAGELQTALDAMQMFHGVIRPAAPEPLSARLGMIRGGLSMGLGPDALQVISNADLGEMYAFLAMASDDDFARALSELGPRGS